MRTPFSVSLLALAGITSLSAADKPNILLVMLDDVGAEAFTSYYGNPVNTADGQSIETPNVDTLASTGMRFTNALATPLCTPTRVQLMTGKYNYRNYRGFGYLDNTETTMAQVLRDNGYATATAGKWQLSTVEDFPSRHTDGEGFSPTGVTEQDGVIPRVLADDYGFEAYQLWYVNYTFANKGNRYWNPKLETSSGDGLSSVVIPTGSSDYGPDLNTAYLKQFISDSVDTDTPFFAYYPLTLPHGPWVGTPDSSPIGDKATSDPVYFDDNVEYADKLLGELIDHLGDPDGDPLTDDSILNDTVVIFTSDNGTDDEITIQTDSGNVTGAKQYPTYYGTHVPFVISWPGKVAAGTSDRMIDFTDIFPTLLAVAGIEQPLSLGLDGQPIIDANGGVLENRDIAYCYYKPLWGNTLPDNVVWEFAQDARYKLYGDGRLYDIDADPAETTDLSGGSLDAGELAAMAVLQAELDRHAALQAKTPLFLNGMTREVLDTDLDGTGDTLSTSFVRFGDNDANNKEFRTIAEFDLTDPRVAALIADFGSAMLAAKVTYTKGTPPDLRVVALSSGEDGSVTTSDYQAAGTEVAVVPGLQEGDEIWIDVTEIVRADLGQSYTAFRFEGIGVDAVGTPGADQVRLSGKPGVDDVGTETATRLIIGPKGDLDLSGFIDLGDFHLFREAYAANSVSGPADLNVDGHVDEDDFALFRDRFSQMDSSGLDLNGDGRPDLVDYAFQILSPGQVAGRLPTTSVAEEGGQTYPQISYRRFPGGNGDSVSGYSAGGVRYMAQRSPDLGPGDWDQGSSWFVELPGTVANPDGTESVTVQSLTALTDREFLRLSVELP